MGSETELLVCETCHEPKEKRQEFRDADGKVRVKTVPIACRCDRQAATEADTTKRKQLFNQHMKELQAKYGLSDGFYAGCTFERDDRRDLKLSSTCRSYVKNWEDMRENGMGILFYGPPGTGKSFYACAIANALMDRQIAAVVTNFPRLLNILQAAKDRQQHIDALQRYQLLVVDDLGVERESAYAAEQVYSVIDARSRSGLPLIVTTNMTMTELEDPGTMQGSRIYDRILEMCPIRLKMTGESRRAGKAEERKRLAKVILAGEDP